VSEALDHLTAAQDALSRLRVVLERPDSDAAPAPAQQQDRPIRAPAAASAWLADPAAFFAAARHGVLGPVLSQDEVDGCTITLKACAAARWPVSWAAYGLATKYHETAGTMRPIREYGKGRGRPYGAPGRNGGQVPYGRGDVQLTHDDNYERADRELGLNGALVANYDLALDPDIAARIMVWGMQGGRFTGKGLADYLPAVADIHQFSNARRIINGLDKAVLIAGYALEFQSDLQAGGWS
jgi:hypothetical protein